MRKTKESLFSLVLSSCLLNSVMVPSHCFGQSAKSAKGVQRLSPVKYHPELSIDFGDRVRVKISVLKNRFGPEELFKVDVAVLLENGSRVYFPSDPNYRISIMDIEGKPITVESLFAVDRRRDRLPPYQRSHEGIFIDEHYFLVGCHGPALTAVEQRFGKAWEGKRNPRTLFDAGVFRSAANSCIDISGPMDLVIHVEVFNDTVVVDRARPLLKTLTGKVKSNELRITITR